MAINTKEYNKEVRKALRTIKDEPENVQALLTIAHFRNEEGKHTLAQENFLKVTLIEQDNLEAWRGLAAVYKFLQNDMGARYAQSVISQLTNKSQTQSKQTSNTKAEKRLAYVALKAPTRGELIKGFNGLVEKDPLRIAEIIKHNLANNHEMTGYRTRKDLNPNPIKTINSPA